MTIDPTELTRMWEAGDPIHAIAAHFGVTERAVDYRRKKLGLPARSNRFTPEDVARYRLLEKEGMPLRYIEDDLGRCRGSGRLYRFIEDRAAHARNVKEWQRVWPTIRRNPVLLELHREFMLR